MAAEDGEAELGLTTRPDNFRRCFICLDDEDPADPQHEWVDFCPCSLEAHQGCMQCWAFDCERASKPLKCPMCKANVEFEGRGDWFVKLNDLIRSLFRRASPFVLMTGFAMGVQFSLQMYGALAMWTFAGKNAMMRFLLGPGMVFDGQKAGRLRTLGERIWSSLIMMNVGPALVFGRMMPNVSNTVFMSAASLVWCHHLI